MNRKYINKDDKSKKDDIFDKHEKEVFFKKDPTRNSTKKHLEDLGGDIKEANTYINSLSKHIAEQKAKVNVIKKMQDDFEKELGILTPGEHPIPVQTSKTEFENLGKEFESDKIINNITNIVEKEAKNRIMALESQLEEEKRNSTEFRKLLEQNLRKFNSIEKNLKGQKTMLESEIKEKTQKLTQAERLSTIGELASRLAHDLRNPLSVVKGTAQLIKVTNKSLDESTLKRIDLIEKSIFRMTHQIEGVLDYVKGPPLVKKEPASLRDIIISTLQTLMIPSSITVNLPKEDVMVLCDSQKIQVVFSNMIFNAIQAIGGDAGTINIRYKRKQDNIEIKIEDSGPGISEELMKKIFDPLFTTKQEGTGLGLASCKSIIEQHGGKITVSNTPTTFTIILPV